MGTAVVDDGRAVDVAISTQKLPVTVAVYVLVAGPSSFLPLIRWRSVGWRHDNLPVIDPFCLGVTRGGAVIVKLSFLGFRNPRRQLPLFTQDLPHLVYL